MQLCRLDDGPLDRNIRCYLDEGLKQGDGILAFVVSTRREAILRDYSDAIGTRQLVVLDAQDTADWMVKDGLPDWDRFAKRVRSGFRLVQRGHPSGALRTYGEMGSIFRKSGQFGAAVLLEQFWNKLLEQLPASIYCSYEIDFFGEEFDPATVQGALGLHTHLMCCEATGTLNWAIQTAMEEALGGQAEEIRSEIRANHPPAWPQVPEAEAAVLWLRTSRPEKASEILARAQALYDTGPGPRNEAIANA
jgi:hypothetical protein